MSTPTTTPATNKNIRLSFDAWKELRRMKFEQRMTTYTELFSAIYKKVGENVDITSELQQRLEEAKSESGNKDAQESDGKGKFTDKTIVVSDDMHYWLTKIKVNFMIEYGATSRGPGAIALSDVVIALLKQYVA